DRLVTGNMLLPSAAYASDRRIDAFQRLALQRLAALPGVASASVSWAVPFFGLAEPRKYLVAGHEVPQRGREPVGIINGVSSSYFETVGTRLLSGRVFNDSDTLDSPKVFVINQTMARGLFGGESPIGRRLARADGGTPEWGEIVGVVTDIQSLVPDKITAAYQLYQPLSQEPRPAGVIAVRAAGKAPAALIPDIRNAMAALDAALPLRPLHT